VLFRSAWNGLWLVLASWVTILLPFCYFMPEMFALMRDLMGVTVSDRVAKLETDYGQILLLGMVFTISARGMSNFFYGIHKANIVMISTIIANIINFVCTIALVLGVEQLGIPAMGVRGAAIGTVIGSIIEFGIPMALFLSRSYNEKYATRAAWKFSPKRMRELLKLGWPAGAMWGNEMVCWWIFLAGFVGTFDDPSGPAIHAPAGWITLQYMHISFMPAVGLSIAVSAIVGKCIGAGRPDLAAKRTILGLQVTMAYMGFCALIFVLFRNQLIDVFAQDNTPEVREQLIAIGSRLLILAAIFQLFDALAITLSGALRGAGDTVWPGMLTIVLSWTCIVGGGWVFVRFWPEIGSLGPWIGAAAYIIALALALLFRFQGGKWKTMSVVNQDGIPNKPLQIGRAHV